jgi:hypothetical protein
MHNLSRITFPAFERRLSGAASRAGENRGAVLRHARNRSLILRQTPAAVKIIFSVSHEKVNALTTFFYEKIQIFQHSGAFCPPLHFNNALYY